MGTGAIVRGPDMVTRETSAIARSTDKVVMGPNESIGESNKTARSDHANDWGPARDLRWTARGDQKGSSGTRMSDRDFIMLSRAPVMTRVFATLDHVEQATLSAIKKTAATSVLAAIPIDDRNLIRQSGMAAGRDHMLRLADRRTARIAHIIGSAVASMPFARRL